MTHAIDILYEDNHVLGVYKPGGLLVQGDKTGDITALDLARSYIKETHEKPGKVFLGLVHRIDRPVSGVVVFARTSKAASRIARSFHDRKVEKAYLAVVVGAPPEDEDTLVAHLERTHNRSRFAVQPTEQSKEAQLVYRVLERGRGVTLVEVVPHTGRHHQIRLQLAGEGCPVVGDLKYGAPEPLADKTIALHAVRLRLPHPVKDETVTVSAPPPDMFPWSRFERRLREYSDSLNS